MLRTMAFQRSLTGMRAREGDDSGDESVRESTADRQVSGASPLLYTGLALICSIVLRTGQANCQEREKKKRPVA